MNYKYIHLLSDQKKIDIDDMIMLLQMGLLFQKRWYDCFRESCSSKTYQLTQSEVFMIWLNTF